MQNKYAGSYYAVSLDGDYQVWVYRQDLFDNAENQKDFKAKYGYDLAFPKTWKQHADVAAFFTQPNQKLYGSIDLKNPLWGYSNWMMRYVSAANPNQYYFDLNAKPLINGPAGIQATKEHVASMAWTYPDTLSKSWPEEYAAMGAGNAAMATMFSNVTKFIPGNPGLDTANPKIGSLLRTAVAPGRMVGGKLIRRSIIYQNNQFVVNAFASKKLQEPAYLVLQWLSSRSHLQLDDRQPGRVPGPEPHERRSATRSCGRATSRTPATSSRRSSPTRHRQSSRSVARASTRKPWTTTCRRR